MKKDHLFRACPRKARNDLILKSMTTKTAQRIAIVHDYIKEYGGAERVLEELIKIFPQADIYTSVYIPRFLGPHEARFRSYNIRTSGLQHFPFKEKLISPFRLFAPFAFAGMNLTSYDVVIVSQTGAYFPNLIHKGKATLICYTHTPPRYLYGYATARDWKKNKLKLFAGSAMNHVLRMVDYNASKNVDVFLANSQEVAGRIKKFYNREATVIYPPVLGSIPQKKVEKQDFFLTGGRLARAKGTDIIIKAFNKNGKRLKVFGRGFAGYEQELQAIAKKNIEFVGEVTEEQKNHLLARAKAFVFASFDEDFGITPVEAMGAGTPVIAYKSGGVKETVVEGKTGVFFENNSPEDINIAIKRFEKISFHRQALIKQAEKFSATTFDKKILDAVRST